MRKQLLFFRALLLGAMLVVLLVSCADQDASGTHAPTETEKSAHGTHVPTEEASSDLGTHVPTEESTGDETLPPSTSEPEGEKSLFFDSYEELDAFMNAADHLDDEAFAESFGDRHLTREQASRVSYALHGYLFPDLWLGYANGHYIGERPDAKIVSLEIVAADDVSFCVTWLVDGIRYLFESSAEPIEYSAEAYELIGEIDPRHLSSRTLYRKRGEDSYHAISKSGEGYLAMTVYCDDPSKINLDHFEHTDFNYAYQSRNEVFYEPGPPRLFNRLVSYDDVMGLVHASETMTDQEFSEYLSDYRIDLSEARQIIQEVRKHDFPVFRTDLAGKDAEFELIVREWDDELDIQIVWKFDGLRYSFHNSSEPEIYPRTSYKKAPEQVNVDGQMLDFYWRGETPYCYLTIPSENGYWNVRISCNNAREIPTFDFFDFSLNFREEAETDDLLP